MLGKAWTITGLLVALAAIGAASQPRGTPASPPSPAQATPTPESPIQLSAIAVEGVDFALLLRHGSAWRVAPEWQRVWRAAGAVAPLASRLPAWDELARSMSQTRESCFDHLLGSRAGVVVEAPDLWSVVSDVGEATSASLESALKTAPRGIEQGQQRSLVDRGRFSLVKILASDGKAPARLSLSDARRTPNPDRVAESLAGLDSVCRDAAGDSMLGSAALMWSAALHPKKSSRLIAGVARKGATAQVRLVADASWFGLDEPAAAKLAGRSQLPATLSDSVLLSVSGRLPASFMPAMKHTSDSIRAVLALIKAPLPDPGVFGEEVLLRIESPVPQTIGVTVGISTKDAARAAEHADRLVTSILESAGRAAGAGGVLGKLPEFDPKSPRDPLAIRLVAFEKTKERAATTIAWACFAGEPNADGTRPGWFVMHIRAGDDNRDRAELELRRQGATVLFPTAELLRIMVRPHALSALLGDNLGNVLADGLGFIDGAAEWMELAQSIDEIDARLVATASGRVEGTGRVVAREH